MRTTGPTWPTRSSGCAASADPISIWAGPPLAADPDAAAILVLDDAGQGFRDVKPAWDLLARTRPDKIVYKMARPLARGELWDEVRPRYPDGKRDPERLVVVLSADDLRAEGIAISRCLSGERTAEEFVRQLAANGALVSLVTCAHLIVRFDCDAVIHHRGTSAERPMLYFDSVPSEAGSSSCHGRVIV